MLGSDTDLTGRVQGGGNIFVHLIVRCKHPESLYHLPLSLVQGLPNYVICPSSGMQTISEYYSALTDCSLLPHAGLVVPQKSLETFDQITVISSDRLNERSVTLLPPYLAERWRHRITES